MAFGRFAGALTSLLYWAGTPMWLGGSVAVVAMSVYGRFFGELAQPALYLFGAGFIGLATVGAVVPLRYGKWLPTSGAVGQIGLLSFFTASVAIYGARHGVHGIAVGDLTPTSATFIAVVPVLLYSFVGVELPSTAGEEMRNPRRDIPVAIARAGIGQALMYGIPILAVLLVLPAEQVTSLGGLIDAMKTVFTVYGGSVAADGSVALSGPGSCSAGPAPWCSSGCCWPAAQPGSWAPAGPRRRPAWTAPAAGPRPGLALHRRAGGHGAGVGCGIAGCDGGQPVDHQGRRAEVLLGRPDRLHRPDRARLPVDLPGVPGPAAAPARAGAPVPGPGRPGRDLADHRPGHRLVAARHRLPALAGPGHGRPRRLAAGRLPGPAPGVRAAGPGPAGDRGRCLHCLPPHQPPVTAAAEGSSTNPVTSATTAGSRRIRRWPRPLVDTSRAPGQDRAMAALSAQAVSVSWRSWTSSRGGGAARAGTAKAAIEVPTRRSILATRRERVRSPKPRRPANTRV